MDGHLMDRLITIGPHRTEGPNLISEILLSGSKYTLAHRDFRQFLNFSVLKISYYLTFLIIL